MKDIARIFINIVGYVVLLAGVCLCFYVLFQVVRLYSDPARTIAFFENLGSPWTSKSNDIIVPPQLVSIVFLFYLAFFGEFGLKIIRAGHRVCFGKIPKRIWRPVKFDSRISKDIREITQRMGRIEELLSTRKKRQTYS